MAPPGRGAEHGLCSVRQKNYSGSRLLSLLGNLPTSQSDLEPWHETCFCSRLLFGFRLRVSTRCWRDWMSRASSRGCTGRVEGVLFWLRRRIFRPCEEGRGRGRGHVRNFEMSSTTVVGLPVDIGDTQTIRISFLLFSFPLVPDHLHLHS